MGFARTRKFRLYFRRNTVWWGPRVGFLKTNGSVDDFILRQKVISRVYASAV